MVANLFSGLALLSTYAAAYPFVAESLGERATPVERSTPDLTVRAFNPAKPQGTGGLIPIGGPLPLLPPPFDPASQYVSNKGQYKFVAPGPKDARGMCPGLNAMANHGYLPHNGVATIAQFRTATEKVFGMAPDLGAFLAIYGAVVDGTLTSWSIEGTPHIGIGGSHGNYEADSSPLKADLNQYGSNTRLIMSQFYDLYNSQPDAATANYNLDVLRDFRERRFNESIAKNPNFFYGPFAGNIVTQAAFTFIYRFMSNKSAEYPEGVLNKEVLKSFMSIYGDDENNLKWVPGNERIPDNWYKRNAADEYSIAYFATDVANFASVDPRFILIGCNQGKVNTYNQIDPSLLTSGAYTAASILANPVCFGGQFLQSFIPKVTGVSGSLLQPLISALAPLTAVNGSCPAISKVDLTPLKLCPGASAYGGPTGPVAPGAIQS